MPRNAVKSERSRQVVDEGPWEVVVGKRVSHRRSIRATPCGDEDLAAFLTALATIGEGNHNSHHEFPSDYRNALKLTQYDPTKLFIWTMSKLGLASPLETFPDNEIKKGQYAILSDPGSALSSRGLESAS